MNISYNFLLQLFKQFTSPLFYRLGLLLIIYSIITPVISYMYIVSKHDESCQFELICFFITIINPIISSGASIVIAGLVPLHVLDESQFKIKINMTKRFTWIINKKIEQAYYKSYL